MDKSGETVGSAKTLATYAVDKLRSDILNGMQPPGGRLGIDELKRQLGIGASPLREALNQLAAEGLVHKIDQRGFRVASADRAELADLIETRCLIEGAALRAAIARLDAEAEERIVVAHHRLSRVSRSLANDRFISNPAWDELHMAFHLALIAACGARELLDIARGLHQRATRFRNISNSVGWKQREVGAEHEALVRAVLARQPDEATHLLETHYRRTAEFLDLRQVEKKTNNK
ncbi:MAG TPA: GntR family transcriptional regulator [Acetobacteraceae bacterium]|jgi:GntR family transcriptional regulator, carbon starvation induced regulator|nr:GntR family transcriptional regulator [Acetobacteraceae bacterium]